MKRTISIVLALILCFSITASAISFPSGRVGKDITMHIVAPYTDEFGKILYFNVYNEKDQQISSKATSIIDIGFAFSDSSWHKYLVSNQGTSDVDEYILWDISFVVETSGRDREFTFVPVTADGEWEEYAFTDSITIYPEQEIPGRNPSCVCFSAIRLPSDFNTGVCRPV